MMNEFQATRFLNGALAGVARRAVGLTEKDVSPVCGKSFTTIANAENGLYALSEPAERALLLCYLQKLHEMSGSPLPEGTPTIEQLRVLLAQALLIHRATKLTQAASGSQGGSRDLLLSVVKAGLEEAGAHTRYKDRLRRLLGAFLEYQQARFSAV